jgi:Putative MetA-pathway of phenol degradation
MSRSFGFVLGNEPRWFHHRICNHKIGNHRAPIRRSGPGSLTIRDLHRRAASESHSCRNLLKRFLPTSVIMFCTHLVLADEDSSRSSTPAPNKSQYTLFSPTPIDLRRPYNTDRPSKTDSPFTIDAGVFQIESDVWNWTLDYENGVRTRTWIISNTNFKLGLTNWMDLQIFPQFYVNTRTSGPAFGKPVEQDGFGDTTVRLKINLLGNDGGKLVVGFLSSLKMPTNTGHTGNHVWEPGFGLPVNYSLPWGFTLFAQTRIDILDKPRSSKMRGQWQNPIGLSRTIVGNLSGYVEFYDAVGSGPWVGTLDTGLIYQVTPNFSIDVDAFFGLTHSAPDYNVFTGFGYRF